MDLELILLRRLASILSMPVFLMDEDEGLLFYNQAGERLLGRRSDEVGAMKLEDIPSMFLLGADDGSLLPLDDFPLAIALRQRRPAHLRLKYRALDGAWRSAEVTAFPLEGQGGRHLGAAAIWWEAEVL